MHKRRSINALVKKSDLIQIKGIKKKKKLKENLKEYQQKKKMTLIKKMIESIILDEIK